MPSRFGLIYDFRNLESTHAIGHPPIQNIPRPVAQQRRAQRGHDRDFALFQVNYPPLLKHRLQETGMQPGGSGIFLSQASDGAGNKAGGNT